MLFKKKIERALKANRERLKTERRLSDDEFDKTLFLKDNQEKVDLEKGDLLAMILAGFYVMAPLFIIIILLLILISFL